MLGYNEKHSDSWESGLLIGDGQYGAMVFGDVENEEIIVSHHHSFLKTNNMDKIPKMAPYLNEMRSMIKEKGYEEALQFYLDTAIENGYAGLTMSDFFHPIYHVSIQHNKKSHQGYKRYYTDNPEEGFVSGDSFKHEYMFCDGKFLIKFENEDNMNSNIFFNFFQEEGIVENITEDNNALIYELKYIDNTGFKSTLKIETDGKVEIVDKSLGVKNYKKLLIEITNDHQETNYYSKKTNVKSSLLVHDLKDEISNETLISNIDKEAFQKLFISRFYNNSIRYIKGYSGYGIPNLQGVWSGDFNPAWSGDYTFDTNVQLAISSYLSLGMFSEMRAFFKHYASMFDDFRQNAQDYFGCRGFLVPGHASRRALHIHWNNEWPLIFWFSGAGWFAKYYHEYYQYTLDKSFLEQEALPYYIEALSFYMDYAQIVDDRVLLSPTYSPENGLGDNATIDIMVIRDLIKNIEEAWKILSLEPLEEILNFKEKLPEYLVEDDILREWIDKDTKENYNHRHFAHFHGVFETKEITKDHTLWEPSKKAFEKRLKHWFYNQKQDTSSVHGKMHTGFIATAFEMDDVYDDVLASLMVSKNYYHNLVTSHYNFESVFNLDGSGSFPKLIVDSLLYVEKDGSITIRKIKSKYLTKGKLKDIWLPNNIKVKELSWYDDNWEMILELENDGQIVINDGDNTVQYPLNKGDNTLFRR